MIIPVILSGGGGTRLWPLSRTHFPKQYWPLVSAHTLLQETVFRVISPDLFTEPFIICNEEHRFLVAEQLRQVNITPSQIVLETKALNTAAAIAIACLLQKDLDSLLLVLPADHVIQQLDAFHSAIVNATPAAENDKIVTFGILANQPETRYGYIQKGNMLEDSKYLYHVSKFVEKPNLSTAKQFLESKDYYWNSGIFLFKVRNLLAEFERLQPQLVDSCRAALWSACQDLDFLRLDSASIISDSRLSLDYAIMEHTPHAAVIPVNMGWSDIGTWDALWSLSPKDEQGNVTVGDVMVQNVHNSYVRSDDQLLSILGLDNVIVVATNDAILVAHQDHVQEVKELVQRLEASKRRELDVHTCVYRPWGSYQIIDLSKRFQVKHIIVNPGAKTSTQIHYHRSEHWVVVEGVAKVIRGDETLLIHENESVYLPMGIKHRVENPGKIPLHFIEVQSGSYLGEDDIVRIEDDYGRADTVSAALFTEESKISNETLSESPSIFS